MFALLTIDVARDAVARQFDYADEVAGVAPAAAATPPARRTRARLADVLHRAADAVAPATYHPAH